MFLLFGRGAFEEIEWHYSLMVKANTDKRHLHLFYFNLKCGEIHGWKRMKRMRLPDVIVQRSKIAHILAQTILEAQVECVYRAFRYKGLSARLSSSITLKHSAPMDANLSVRKLGVCNGKEVKGMRNINQDSLVSARVSSVCGCIESAAMITLHCVPAITRSHGGSGDVRVWQGSNVFA